jgi:hypothetical protein
MDQLIAQVVKQDGELRQCAELKHNDIFDQLFCLLLIVLYCPSPDIIAESFVILV